MQNHKLIPFLITSFIMSAEIAISFNSVLLPNLKEEFFISEQIAQMTIASGLFALGFSGFIYGGLSDSMGRRPIILFSSSLFCISTLFCFFAPNVQIFLIARFLQGLGSGAGWVVGNSCLKDIFSGKKYIKVMNYIHAVAGILPAIVPVVGSYIAVKLGWRICFLGLFIFSFVSVCLMFFYQTETIPEKKKINFKLFVQGYKDLFKSKKFLSYLIIKVTAVMLILCEISNVPLIFVEHLDVLPENYGFYVMPVFLIYVFGTVVSDYLNNFYKVDNLLKFGFFLLILGNALVLIINNYTEISAISIQLCKSLVYLGWGFIFGNATAKVVSSVPEKSGMASATMIALEMFFGSLGIYFLSIFFNGTIVPLSIFMIISSSLAFFAFKIKK